MKKLALHLDAAIVIALVFLLAVGFIAFQWRQNSQLAQANIDLQLKATILELQQVRLEAEAKKCAPEKR